MALGMTRKAGRGVRNALCLLPADWYLPTFLSLTIFTEILRLRLGMTRKAGREAHNAGSFLRKELGGALRIGPKTQRTDLTPLSSVA